ncbi:hypothetical protein DPX16_22344 [Anabarilius grahami]|uniref:Uncharacterized protein n=1 Tax=Anabarilius grahami TaxID=495550 RepID=A0A3N0YRJ2_ANAGA|nr:hypothetical protein DPX16_22344 [Anabarilius grahami]
MAGCRLRPADAAVLAGEATQNGRGCREELMVARLVMGIRAGSQEKGPRPVTRGDSVTFNATREADLVLSSDVPGVKPSLSEHRISQTQPPLKGAGKSDCRRQEHPNSCVETGIPESRTQLECYEPSYRGECIPLV